VRNDDGEKEGVGDTAEYCVWPRKIKHLNNIALKLYYSMCEKFIDAIRRAARSLEISCAQQSVLDWMKLSVGSMSYRPSLTATPRVKLLRIRCAALRTNLAEYLKTPMPPRLRLMGECIPLMIYTKRTRDLLKCACSNRLDTKHGFGANGALRIERSNGVAEIDKPGADQKTIADLLSENSNDNE
jgi:hypothetical protein